jgi:hypothetical protein
LFVKELVRTDENASVLFTDTKGEVKGSIHYSLLDSFGNILLGSTMVLVDVPLFKPEKYKKYLIVSKCNLKIVYTKEGEKLVVGHETDTENVPPIQDTQLVQPRGRFSLDDVSNQISEPTSLTPSQSSLIAGNINVNGIQRDKRTIESPSVDRAKPTTKRARLRLEDVSPEAIITPSSGRNDIASITPNIEIVDAQLSNEVEPVVELQESDLQAIEELFDGDYEFDDF